MVEDIEKSDLGSSKDNQKPVQKTPKPRRRFIDIENAIYDSIKKFPKSTYSISKDIGATIRTTRRHLGVMHHRKIIYKYKDKFGEYWRLER